MLTRDQFAVGTNLLFHAFHKRLRKKYNMLPIFTILSHTTYLIRDNFMFVYHCVF